MFNRSNNVLISNSAFWQLNSPEQTGLQRLHDAVASSAFHNSDERFDPPKCHPGTRIAIIERIMAWIRVAHDHEDIPAEELVLWLSGMAGAGKSAICQCIAEKCEDARLLLASFFFSRSDPTRNNGRPLIPTISYQISSIFPEIRPHLEETIRRDPLIFKRSIEAQIQALIIAPMQELSTLDLAMHSSRLIVIDGLDECSDPKVQENILVVIENSLRQHRLPLIFLIASRPEPHIAYIFNSSRFSGIHAELPLNDAFDPTSDILLFLRESFKEISVTHRFRSTIPRPWPTSQVLDFLARKASGMFLYASLIVNYVKSARHPPASRLDVVIGLRPTGRDSPFAELDALFIHILEGVEDIDTALILLPYLWRRYYWWNDPEDRDPNFIAEFLGLDLQALEVCVGDLSSLVTITNDESSRVISMPHPSILEFLYDPLRSGKFYVHDPTLNTMIARQPLHHLTNHSSLPFSSVWELFPYSLFDYAGRMFTGHFKNAAMTEDLGFQISKFSIFNLPEPVQLEFACEMVPELLDTMKDKTWQGSQEVYVRLHCECSQILSSAAQKYYAHPKTTLLLALLGVDLSILKSSPRSMNHNKMRRRVFQLKLGFERPTEEDMFLNRIDSFQLQHNAPSFNHRTHQLLQDTLDRNIYSVAALMLLEDLCNHRKHRWLTGHPHGHFMRERRTNRPWMWLRMRKPGGTLERARREKRVRHKRRLRLYISAMKKFVMTGWSVSWVWSERQESIAAYNISLRLFVALIHRAIEAQGDFNSGLVSFARRCTFAMVAGKFPRDKKAAKEAIAELLANVDTVGK